MRKVVVRDSNHVSQLKCARNLRGYNGSDQLQSIGMLDPIPLEGEHDATLSILLLDLICLGVYRRTEFPIGGIVHLPHFTLEDMTSNAYLKWLVEESFFKDAYEWVDVVTTEGEVLVPNCILVRAVESLTSSHSKDTFSMLSCLVRHAWEYAGIIDVWKRFVSERVDKNFAYLLAHTMTRNGIAVRESLHNPIAPLENVDCGVLLKMLDNKLFKVASSVELTNPITFARGFPRSIREDGRSFYSVLEKDEEKFSLPYSVWPFKLSPQTCLENVEESRNEKYDVSYVTKNWREILKLMREMSKE